VAIDLHAVDFLHVFGEELSDVLIGRPVDRHAEVIAILGLELFLQVRAIKPVLAEPVKVGELLVGQLIELAIGTGGELGADEVGEIETGVGHILAFAGHEVREVHRLLQARVGADQIGVIDVDVIKVPVGLHLGLHGLNHFAFTEDLMVHLDAGDFLKGLGQHS